MIYLDSYNSFSVAAPTAQEYPPNGGTWSPAVDGNVLGSSTLSGAAYGNGVYTPTTSSINTYGYPWGGFEKNLGTIARFASAAVYNSGTGTYPGSTSTNGILGEWLQIQLPVAITINSFSLQQNTTGFQNSAAASLVLFASNDGTTWTSIDTETGITQPTAGQIRTYTVSGASAYSYYRLVCTQTLGGVYFLVGELRLFGI